ncbi:MAG: zf-HC2 domain-containing protein [Armatimonadota bacterium]
MKCRQVRKLMGAYLYGDLEPEDMRDIRLHTQVCEQCRADLESRGMVVSSLNAQAPVLDDQDKQQLARSVKKAIDESGRDNLGLNRANEPGAALWWWRPASAVALAGFVLAGFAIGRHIGSSGGLFAGSSRSAINNSNKARVTITEAAPAARQDNDKTSASRDGHQSISRSKKIENMADYARRMAVPAVTGPTDRNSNNDKRKSVIPDEPVSVAGQSDIKKEQEKKDATKLPKPTGLNDAQTTDE